MEFKVYYKGFYIVEAESLGEALNTSRDDAEVEYEEWQNVQAEEADDGL